MTHKKKVIVLGDRGTAEHSTMIGQRAAEMGAQVVDLFAFELGEAIAADDLADVDAVVRGLGRAIETRACIWVPFPAADFRREQHLRRLAMVAQRHGLDVLVGPDLLPSGGGYNEIDFALRQEVRAVDGLDVAAIAAAGIETLTAEIEQALATAHRPVRHHERGTAMRTSTNYPTWAHDGLVHAWWVIPGRLLAGEYPGAREPEKTAAKLRVLTDAGVNSFVNLTEVGEPTWGGEPMRPYDGPGVPNHHRFPIRDTSVIDDAGYDRILDHIRAELAAGRVVYVHCWGGKGRTGTVVGAWLIAEEGLDYPAVLDRMNELRRGTRKAHHPVPDTKRQHAVLRRRAQRAEAGR